MNERYEFDLLRSIKLAFIDELIALHNVKLDRILVKWGLKYPKLQYKKEDRTNVET